MTTPPSPHDLDDLRADWQALDAPGPAAEAIRHYVRARTRQYAIWAAVEIVVGTAGLVVLVGRAWRSPDPAERLAMGTLAVVVVVALVGGWWNWAGVIASSARSTADFVALSLERLRRRRRAYVAGWGLLAAEVGLFAYWLGSRASTTGATAGGFLWLAVVTGVAVGFLLWVRRSLAREERRFAELRRALGD